MRTRVLRTASTFVLPAIALAWAGPSMVFAQRADAGAMELPVVRLNGRSGGRIENGYIAAEWALNNGHLASIMIFDKAVHDPNQPAALRFADPFSMELQGQGVVHASDLALRGEPREERVAPDSSASRYSDRLPGEAVHYTLADPQSSFTVDWTVVLRQGSKYIRQIVTVTAGEKPLPLSGMILIDAHLPGVEATGKVRGSPLVFANFFLGFESPLSESSVVADRGVSQLRIGVPIAAGHSAAFSSVVGIAPPGQMRRAFLEYLERERAHPYRTFLHYNSWFDIGFGKPYTQKEALDRIHAIGDELNKKRGVTLDSFLFDDGWDDLNHLWKIRPDFTDGFEPLTKAAAEYGAAPGVWLSPWGGYDKAKQARLVTARREGYEIVNGGLALSGPKYYALFHSVASEMVTKYAVNQFKFDGTGNVNQVVPGSAFSSDFDAAIHLIGDLRRIKPDLYINLTSGTWPSPFWLFYADSTWRGGEDTDFTGVGTDRERWITYRDAMTYEHIVEGGRLYPLNSLMLHGIVFAEQAPGLSTGSEQDFANEVHSYFGSGTQLQELYVTPSLLSATDWDVLAEAAKWSRTNASTLVDTHWIGGDPQWLEAYGWAAWSPEKGILTLRNPGATAQDFSIDVGSAFELPNGAPRRYQARSPWKAGASEPAVELEAGKPHAFHLAPFQVLTLEAVPQP